jgi:hypothetical protein
MFSEPPSSAGVTAGAADLVGRRVAGALRLTILGLRADEVVGRSESMVVTSLPTHSTLDSLSGSMGVIMAARPAPSVRG